MTDHPRVLLGGAFSAAGEGPSHGRRSQSASGMTSIAWLIDQMAFASNGSAAPGPLQEALQQGDGSDLSLAVHRLSVSQRSRLESAIPAASLEEFLAIARESDPRLFAESLFQWAQVASACQAAWV